MLADIAGYLQIDPASALPEAPLWAALALVLGGLLGEVARRAMGLPRILGYSAAGLLVGALLGRELALLLLGLVVLALMAARGLNLSTLLGPLLAGVLLRNITDRPWVWPRHFGTAGGVLVLMMFVVVGGAWSVPAVAAGGGIALVLLAVRALAKTAAVMALAPASGLHWRQGPRSR